MKKLQFLESSVDGKKSPTKPKHFGKVYFHKRFYDRLNDQFVKKKRINVINILRQDSLVFFFCCKILYSATEHGK